MAARCFKLKYGIKTMRKMISIIAFILLPTHSLLASGIGGNGGPVSKEWEYCFGDTRIVQWYDTAQHHRHFFLKWLPTHATAGFYIYKQRKLVGKFDDVLLHQIYASDDNNFFLGLSRAAMYEPAYIVFDSKGNIIKAVKHYSPQINYHTTTSGYIRWHSEENVDAEFDIQEGSLVGISINDVNETRISLNLEPTSSDLVLKNLVGMQRLKTNSLCVSAIIPVLVVLYLIKRRSLTSRSIKTA